MQPAHGSDAFERRRRAVATYLEVMTVPHRGTDTPFSGAGLLAYVFGEVWSRPGLSRRDRRLVTLACVGAADTPEPIEANVYAALDSGDLTDEAALEFVLHFAVYCGGPKRPSSSRSSVNRGSGSGRRAASVSATRPTTTEPALRLRAPSARRRRRCARSGR